MEVQTKYGTYFLNLNNVLLIKDRRVADKDNVPDGLARVISKGGYATVTNEPYQDVLARLKDVADILVVQTCYGEYALNVDNIILLKNTGDDIAKIISYGEYVTMTTEPYKDVKARLQQLL